MTVQLSPRALKKMAASLLMLVISVPAAAVVLTGAVRSDGAQEIFTPPSMSSPVVLRFYVDDGSAVKKGDPLLSIDAGQAASQLRNLREQIAQSEATSASETAKLKLAQIDAELALVDANAARDTAAVDAGIPKQLISALDYDRYQGTFESDRRDAALKAKQLAAARAAVTQRQHDGDLQEQKLRLQQTFYQSQVDTATVSASQDGVVIHSFQGNNPFGGGGGRFEQGSTSWPGSEVGQVVAPTGGHSVRAWALQPDRRALKLGQAVSLSFDALPGVIVGGRIRHISGASQAKPEWGEGRYYVIDIAFDEDANSLPLLPGMSVRVQTDVAAAKQEAATANKATVAVRGAIKASGEIYAQKSVAIMPPQIAGLWQMSVTQMAPDG
ncbi:MAG: HlyD family efflux transporter periplasmic adaptor subunit, partial [Xanthomonadales bacterium]|nr:HlyD family efflux transporter periplasmic adaptor subunit [Xanthomonadales bacterium]